MILLLACAGASLYMAGVIWTIQVVHYALFRQVGTAGWLAYHAAHTQRMTWVVLSPMVVELGTSSLLALAPPPGVPRPLLLLGFALAALTWAVTFFVSVPLHALLSRGWDDVAGAALVRTNWARTALWTCHALVMLLALGCLLRPAESAAKARTLGPQRLFLK